VPRASVLLVLACAASVACALEDPLDPDSLSVDSPLLGWWRLESQLDQYQTSWNLFDEESETRLVGHCDLVADLRVSEVRPSGALTWSLRTSSRCVPPDTVFEAERDYADTWEHTAWGRLQANQVRFTTPWPKTRNGVTEHACTFTGTLTLDGRGRTMEGTATCAHPLGVGSTSWTGTWTGVPVVPATDP
jgi:hypothetical protein